MEELHEVLTDDEDFLEIINIVEHPRAPKTYRNRPNHFEIWNDTDFHKRFRLSKDTVHFIVDNIRNDISSVTDRNHASTAEEMVILTLRFLATGAFLQVVSDFIGLDKSTGSRIVFRVCRAIAGLHRDFIRMPQTEQQFQTTSQEFYNISHFPKCIGALDCSHVKIISPGGNEPEMFISILFEQRRSKFSYGSTEPKLI